MSACGHLTAASLTLRHLACCPAQDRAGSCCLNSFLMQHLDPISHFQTSLPSVLGSSGGVQTTSAFSNPQRVSRVSTWSVCVCIARRDPPSIFLGEFQLCKTAGALHIPSYPAMLINVQQLFINKKWLLLPCTKLPMTSTSTSVSVELEHGLAHAHPQHSVSVT